MAGGLYSYRFPIERRERMLNNSPELITAPRFRFEARGEAAGTRDGLHTQRAPALLTALRIFSRNIPGFEANPGLVARSRVGLLAFQSNQSIRP